MEPIAHLEWTLGISLICFALLGIEINALTFLIIGIGSVFPDLFDWTFFRGKRFSEGHREFSHTIYFITILVLLGFFVPPVMFLAFASILHIFEDILAGRDRARAQ